MPLGSWRLAAASWGTKGPEGTERSDRQKGRTVGIRTGWDRERGQQAETYLRDCRLSLSLRAPAVGTATARATFGHILGHAIRPLAHRRKLFLALASARGELCVTGKTLTSNETTFSCPLSEKGLMRSRGVSRSLDSSSNPHRSILRLILLRVCVPASSCLCACALLGSAESMLYSHTALGCIRPDLISGVVVGCGGLLSRKEACMISRWHCVIKM